MSWGIAGSCSRELRAISAPIPRCGRSGSRADRAQRALRFRLGFAQLSLSFHLGFGNGFRAEIALENLLDPPRSTILKKIRRRNGANYVRGKGWHLSAQGR